MRKWSVENKAALGMLFAIAAIAIMAWGAYGTIHDLRENGDWVSHTHTVRMELAEELSGLSHAEASARAFVITGVEFYAQDFKKASEATWAHHGRVAALTADNERQQSSARELAAAVERRLKYLDQMNSARRNSEEAARVFVSNGSGIVQMEKVRSIMASMRQEEDTLLARREASLSASTEKTLLMMGLLVSVQLVFLGMLFINVRRDLEVRVRSEEILKDYQHQIESQNRQLELRNREVERATKLKSEFLASMSHELRTPLNAIIGFSDLIADGSAGATNEKQKRFIDHVRNGARHLLSLINDILDLSKIEAGQMEFHPEDFAMSEGLGMVISSVRTLAMKKRIKLKAQDAERVFVHADPIRFKQILYNLLSNAIKFTPDEGRVWLEFEVETKHVRISVSDSGPGIRLEDQESIFQEFRQVGDASSGVREGTGLGLAITRRLVEQHGGTIEVKSAPGTGSTFFFTVPLGTAPAVLPPVSEERGAPRENPVVLIVDDEPPARELLVNYLRPAGYETLWASNSSDALAMARRSAPDVITLNMLMPGKRGWETLYELKNDPATRSIPIVIVSVVDNKEMGFTLGASDYLVKPVSRDALLGAIGRHVTPQSSLSNSKVLVVDDDPLSRQLLQSILFEAGYDPLLTSGGHEALDVLDKTAVRAVLLDLVMPELDGFEVLQLMQTRAQLRDLPVFVLTAKTLTDTEAELLRKHTQGFFKKSSAWKEQLLTKIRVATNRSATSEAAP